MNISGRLCRPAFARPLRRTVHATCLKGTQQQLQTSTMSSGHKAGAQPPQISADAGPHQQQQQQQRTRATQGQLVEAAAFPSPVPLIDIGVNLVDKSFQGVRHRRTLVWGQGTLRAAAPAGLPTRRSLCFQCVTVVECVAAPVTQCMSSLPSLRLRSGSANFSCTP